MAVISGIVIAAFFLFIGSKLGYVTVKFHKPADKPTGGVGDKPDVPSDQK